MDNKDIPQPRTSRRTLIKGAIGTALAFAAGRLTAGQTGMEQGNTDDKTARCDPNPLTMASPGKIEQPKVPSVPEKETDKELLNRILNFPPYSPERLALEAQYLGRAENPEQIDRGFWVMTSRDLRGVLLDRRFELRNKGFLPMNITHKEIAWARKNGIHPETLAICKDAEAIAQKVIGDRIKMINPGGLAMLMTEETGRALGGSDVAYGFNNVGEQSAEKHFQPASKAKEWAALVELYKKISRDTDLNFDPHNIAGSYGAGAVGAQYMPSTGLENYKIMERYGLKFNPGDPVMAVVGAYLYVALRGYIRGKSQEMERALLGWNNDLKEARNVLAAANSYYDLFVPINTPAVANTQR